MKIIKNNKYFIFLIICLFNFQCSSTIDFEKNSNIDSYDDLFIGKKIFYDGFNVQNNTILLISSSQFWPYFDKTIDGIKYSIAYNPDTKTITYISTQDPLFKSPDGYKIGDTFSTFNDDLRKKIIQETGWAYFIKLPSGWNAAFIQGSTMTDGNLEDNAKLKWFFKR
jgi:hypothetical protein